MLLCYSSVVQRCDMRDFSKDSNLFVAIERGEMPGNRQGKYAKQVVFNYACLPSII